MPEQARINQMSYTNNLERDELIRRLFNGGRSKSEIARVAQMTRQEIAKALKRLNGNSVITS